MRISQTNLELMQVMPFITLSTSFMETFPNPFIGAQIELPTMPDIAEIQRAIDFQQRYGHLMENNFPHLAKCISYYKDELDSAIIDIETNGPMSLEDIYSREGVPFVKQELMGIYTGHLEPHATYGAVHRDDMVYFSATTPRSKSRIIRRGKATCYDEPIWNRSKFNPNAEGDTEDYQRTFDNDWAGNRHGKE